jgi:tetratricopeptide (TPR) repeat protein
MQASPKIDKKSQLITPNDRFVPPLSGQEAIFGPKPLLALALGVWSAVGLGGCAGRTLASNSPVEETKQEVVSVQRLPAGSGLDTPSARAGYHFSLAQAYSVDGQSDRAVEAYRRALVDDPKSPMIHSRLAAEYVKKGQLSEAIESCKTALVHDPRFQDARLMLAGLYAAARDYASAVAEYEKVLARDPGHEESAVYRAQILVEDGRAEVALKSLREFLKRAPESSLAWYALGRTLQRTGRIPEATQALEKALALKPSFTQAGLTLGFIYEEAGKAEKAIEIYRKLFEEQQDSGAAQRLSTLLLKAEKYREAIPYLEALEAADPDDMNVRVKLGLIHMELKHHEKARKIFQGILARVPDSDRIHYYLGSLYEEMKQFPEAVESLKKVRAESRLFGDSRLHVAYLLKREGRLQDAVSLLEESIQASPRTVGFYVFRANLAEELNDLKGAVGSLEKASRIFPEDEKVSYYLASLYDRIGEVDQGLAEMQRILGVNPNNVDALNYIGYTWTLRGIRLEDAGKYIRKALTLRPDNPYIRDSWGWHLFVTGRTSEAIVELEMAQRQKPQESTILEHLAEAYLKHSLVESAYRALLGAVRNAPDAVARERYQSRLEDIRRQLAAREPGRESSSGRQPAASQR